jgi:hypothetical protein
LFNLAGKDWFADVNMQPQSKASALLFEELINPYPVTAVPGSIPRIIMKIPPVFIFDRRTGSSFETKKNRSLERF